MLGSHYRLQVFNSTGVSITAGNLTIKAKREKFASDGSLSLEGSEASVYSNSGSVATGGYDQSGTIDNTTNLYLGGTFAYKVVTTGSPSGYVDFVLQHSTDGGTTWPSNGGGILVKRQPVSAAGTINDEFRI